MVDWLGHPQSAVAAIFPWAFAGVELWLRTRRRVALLGIAAAVALQFLAGHAETTLHLGLLLTFYAAVRGAVQERERLRAFAGMVVAAAVGTALAGVQLIPFAAELRSSTLVSDRTASGVGFGHLPVGDLLSWVLPNGSGNPGIDSLTGPAPNYLEATGFIGIAALLLGFIGLVHGVRTRRSVALALGVPVVLAALVVYGPLAPVAGRLPLLSSSSNARMIVVICFGMAALAGLGFEAVSELRVRVPRRWSPAGWVLLAVGGAALAGVVALGLVLAAQGKGVDGLLPSWQGNIGFWVLEAGLSPPRRAVLPRRGRPRQGGRRGGGRPGVPGARRGRHLRGALPAARPARRRPASEPGHGVAAGPSRGRRRRRSGTRAHPEPGHRVRAARRPRRRRDHRPPRAPVLEPRGPGLRRPHVLHAARPPRPGVAGRRRRSLLRVSSHRRPGRLDAGPARVPASLSAQSRARGRSPSRPLR